MLRQSYSHASPEIVRHHSLVIGGDWQSCQCRCIAFSSSLRRNHLFSFLFFSFRFFFFIFCCSLSFLPGSTFTLPSSHAHFPSSGYFPTSSAALSLSSRLAFSDRPIISSVMSSQPLLQTAPGKYRINPGTVPHGTTKSKYHKE